MSYYLHLQRDMRNMTQFVLPFNLFHVQNIVIANVVHKMLISCLRSVATWSISLNPCSVGTLKLSEVNVNNLYKALNTQYRFCFPIYFFSVV